MYSEIGVTGYDVIFGHVTVVSRRLVVRQLL